MKSKMMQSFLCFHGGIDRTFCRPAISLDRKPLCPIAGLPTIQDAIDDAPPGQTVLVLDGNYMGNENRHLGYYGENITVSKYHVVTPLPARTQ